MYFFKWTFQILTLLVLWLLAIQVLVLWHHLRVWDEGLLRQCSHLLSPGRVLTTELVKLACSQQPFNENGAPAWCILKSPLFPIALLRAPRGQMSLFSLGIPQ